MGEGDARQSQWFSVYQCALPTEIDTIVPGSSTGVDLTTASGGLNTVTSQVGLKALFDESWRMTLVSRNLKFFLSQFCLFVR